VPQETNSPLAADAIDRLTLSSEPARGTTPSAGGGCYCCLCFEAEGTPAGMGTCGCIGAFCAEAQ
jgi:hypothetical protein